MTDTPLLLSIPEAAQKLGIKRSKLYELINAHKITRVHIGSRALVPMAALTAFVIKAQNGGMDDDDDASH